MVNFSNQIAPIFRKIANVYGVKNACSLGAVLINRLKPEQRETLMGLIAENASIDCLNGTLMKMEAERFRDFVERSKKSKTQRSNE